MKTEFLKIFYKDIDKISSQKVNTDIANTIVDIEKATKTAEIKNIKKLKGYKFAYRIRLGDYRIGVFIENNVVEIARIANRKDIYKIFP